MTFSIVARCSTTGQVGVAIASSSPAVAARCAHVGAGVGAVATQNITNPIIGHHVLAHLGQGHSASEALRHALDQEAFPQARQVLVIDTAGRTAHHSGSGTLGVWAVATGVDCVAGGNLLDNPDVPDVMVKAFCTTGGSLGDRLLASMQGGTNAGGEAGPVYSAGLLIAHQQPWPYVDLRVDWHQEGQPISALAQLWDVYQPQADEYVTRAISPTVAPSFGVPGDQ
jgi:uncharacterized Ntn-hydrolase superfamily protein